MAVLLSIVDQDGSAVSVVDQDGSAVSVVDQDGSAVSIVDQDGLFTDSPCDFLCGKACAGVATLRSLRFTHLPSECCRILYLVLGMATEHFFSSANRWRNDSSSLLCLFLCIANDYD